MKIKDKRITFSSETQTKQTEININEFLTFVWLLSLKCHACLSFVIKNEKNYKTQTKIAN